MPPLSAPSATQALICAEQLGMSYVTKKGDEVLALADVNLDVEQGSFVSVVGPSGCGKSTLLKILAGLLEHTDGEISFGGVPVVGPNPKFGVVFQQPVLLPWLTIRENVLLPMKVQKRPRHVFEVRADELLAMVGLHDFANKYPGELSGGMQQRAGIVRALVTDPEVLLMDEPFGALDALTREQMNEELQRIWIDQKKTVFFITHSIPEAVFLSDRVLVMSPRPGRIVADYQINEPRPRRMEDMSSSAVFSEITAEIRGRLNAKGNLD
jgi:NitT/TauT family transport system ATP-binding protein